MFHLPPINQSARETLSGSSNRCDPSAGFNFRKSTVVLLHTGCIILHIFTLIVFKQALWGHVRKSQNLHLLLLSYKRSFSVSFQTVVSCQLFAPQVSLPRWWCLVFSFFLIRLLLWSVNDCLAPKKKGRQGLMLLPQPSRDEVSVSC